MLGGTPLQSVLGAGVDNTDHEAMRSWIREACKRPPPVGPLRRF